MMIGKQGNVGLIPKEIADKLQGKKFDTFDKFREDFWKTVSDSKYAQEFSKGNIGRMKKGKAPIAIPEQWYGKKSSYNLHHRTPIHDGGGVYDLDNLLIVSPRMHEEILDKKYHLNN